MTNPQRRQKLLLYGEQSERLTFRAITDDDYDIWMEFCQDPSSLQYIMPDMVDKPEEACTKWFTRLKWRIENELGAMNALIEKATGDYVGHCGLLLQQVDGEEVVEVGYSIMPNKRGKGYASEAAIKCKDYFFEQELGDALVSTIDIGNTGSEQVAMHNGMKLAKQGMLAQIDYPINVYKITREEWLAQRETTP